MDFMTKYNEWKNFSELDSELKKELIEIEGNEQEIEDRFHKSLDFGTAGLRGIIGAGTSAVRIWHFSMSHQTASSFVSSIPQTGHFTTSAI